MTDHNAVLALLISRFMVVALKLQEKATVSKVKVKSLYL